MRYGTAHFVNFTKACDYYKSQGMYDGWTPAAIEKDIRAKIAEGEIHIGAPTIKEGQTLSIEDGRYFIEE